MRTFVNGILALLLTCVSGLVLAAVEEGAQLAPEPTVSVGWVYFFVVVFFGICGWFGVAIWRADKKGSDDPSRTTKS